MRAVTWCGSGKISVERVDDPKILNPHDAIVRVTLTAICGSDLHLYNGFIPSMQHGDILGHEFLGEVVEVGKKVRNLKRGDRVVVPFSISCGQCWFCKQSLFALCDNTNPGAKLQEKAYGHAGAGIFGYSHMLGGYAGGQAEYVRVPFANVGPLKIEDGVTDEQALFLSDVFPTGYQAAQNCNINPGDTVAVWGCGPVGQFAIRSAFLLGAERVIAVDHFPTRLSMARDAGAQCVNFDEERVFQKMMDQTKGRGPDSCIDAVGLEAHGMSLDAIYDDVKTATYMATDRAHAFREIVHTCRKGGTISVPGVYGGFVDKVPLGAAFGKGLTLKMGQTHVQRYMRPLMERIRSGQIDPSFAISHRYALNDAPKAYHEFNKQKNEFTKIVMRP